MIARQNKNYCKEKTPKSIKTYDFSDLEKVVLVLMGDEHIGSIYYNKDEHKRILDWCYEERDPIILMGDELETATRDSVGAGIFEQDEIVQEQFEFCENLYKPFADEGLLLGIHIGNHEQRVFNHSGVNLSKMLAKNLNVNYLGAGAVSYIKVGSQKYWVYTTHGNAGSRMPHTKVKSVLDIQNMIEGMDVYGMGHLHQLSHHIKNVYTVNRKKRKIEERQIHFVLTGTFLNHWGSYAHTKNMEPARIGCPKIKLTGDAHQIRISL